ncbi:hypothetical protein H1R20_g4213, partial [Candolleomyces eurysporus]
MSQYNDSYYSGGGGGGGFMGGSPFSQAGSPGARVTVVAQVLQITPQATNCVYILDDGTGRIEARHWVDNASETNAQKWAGLKENMYVRVTGGLKSFGSKRYINALHVRPVTDSYEVFFHQLEAITVTLTIERGAPTGAIQPKNKDVVMSDISAYSAPSTSRLPSDQYSHLPKLSQAICQFMSGHPSTAEGVHVSAIARAVGGLGVDATKISEALDVLMDDGLVYTTTDDSHFALAS